MKEALLFDNRNDPILVTAEEVKEGKYSRDSEFVDPEYEFKVQFVKGAKNNGGPYFRLYYSYEDYRRLFPDKADRYKIVANMRRYYESLWHKQWKQRFEPFCTIEKHIKSPLTNKWKFADAYYEDAKTCIEFQHSYIAFEFEERNKFYSDLGIRTIWLYDLTDANTRTAEDGFIEILENNSNGFFRVSEVPENLSKQNVYIQVKSGKIYRIKELLRRKTSTELKSTIRCFLPSEQYSISEFIEAVKSKSIITEESNNEKANAFLPESSISVIKDASALGCVQTQKTRTDPWDNPYSPWDWLPSPYHGITSIIDFFIKHPCECAKFKNIISKDEVIVYSKDIIGHTVCGYFLKYPHEKRKKVEIYYGNQDVWKCNRLANTRQ